MPTDQIVQLLTVERDRLQRAIDILHGAIKRRGRPPKLPFGLPMKSEAKVVADVSRRKVVKRIMSAAGRKAIGDATRKRWALIKAGKVPSPFAKRKKAAKK
jgi:hypothetical protein